jgi:phosphohistidine phosphatase
MLTLCLLRHAKSSWQSPTLPDRDRPLASRGRAEAPLMGRAMAERGLVPQLVLCSSARRTRDTLDLVLPELKVTPKVIYEDSLYHASSAAMLEMLQGISTSGVGQVLLVGHNPELHALSLDLIGSGPKHMRERLAEKLPTAGLVVIIFLASAWKDVVLNSGEIKLFLTPRLAEED